jgi:hypothetical protein
MPTTRTRRRRRTPIEPDAIVALRSSGELEWSPENWNVLLGVYYFGDYKLADAERERACKLLDQWLERQLVHERAARTLSRRND